MKKILLTGGGTTGHVAVNLALIPTLLKEGWDISYIGSKKGIESELIADYPEVKYYGIHVGKLRRYLSFENIKDFFRVFLGLFQALHLIRKIKPDVVFSKGGYVSVPVVLASAFHHIPIISHESDVTPGLANKISYPFVKKILASFEETMKYLPSDKGVFLGPIIRQQIKGGSREEGLKSYGFSGEKPVLLAMGGSLGSKAINECIWENLDELLKTYDILHQVGKGKGNPQYDQKGYVQVEYITAAMKDCLALADLIVSRAGANAIYEFLYYQKPMLLIPLDLDQSRGDQIVNATNFTNRNFAKTLREKDASKEGFMEKVRELEKDRENMLKAQSSYPFQDTERMIIDSLESLL